MPLSKAQQQVMDLLRNGWVTEPGSGMSILINGKRVCNVDTLRALERAGHVEQMTREGVRQVGQWKAKEKVR